MTFLFDLSACGKFPVVTVSLAIIVLGIALYGHWISRRLHRVEEELAKLNRHRQ